MVYVCILSCMYVLCMLYCYCMYISYCICINMYVVVCMYEYCCVCVLASLKAACSLAFALFMFIVHAIQSWLFQDTDRYRENVLNIESVCVRNTFC